MGEFYEEVRGYTGRRYFMCPTCNKIYCADLNCTIDYPNGRSKIMNEGVATYLNYLCPKCNEMGFEVEKGIISHMVLIRRVIKIDTWMCCEGHPEIMFGTFSNCIDSPYEYKENVYCIGPWIDIEDSNKEKNKAVFDIMYDIVKNNPYFKKVSLSWSTSDNGEDVKEYRIMVKIPIMMDDDEGEYIPYNDNKMTEEEQEKALGEARALLLQFIQEVTRKYIKAKHNSND